MNTLNKRRSGDENIGKLIVFAITIVIAIGLVGLVSYFYTQSRQQAVNTSILSSTNSTPAEITSIKELTTGCATVTGISYDAITNNYSMSFPAAGAATSCAAALANVKGVKAPGVNPTVTTQVDYKMN